MSAPKIVTEHVCPPIPDRSFDWAAYLDGYEPGAPYGGGSTEAEAIRNLRDQVCKDGGGDIGGLGECLTCNAECGEACHIKWRSDV